MRSLFIALGLTATLMVTACAAPGYSEYLKTQEKISDNGKSSANVQSIALQKIATESNDPTVQAVAAMMLGMNNGRQSQQVVAPPQNPALEWFRAASPLLGTWISADYTLRASKDNNATQVQMYNTQMNTFGQVAVQGLQTAQTLGTVGMDYASKPAAEAPAAE